MVSIIWQKLGLLTLIEKYFSPWKLNWKIYPLPGSKSDCLSRIFFHPVVSRSARTLPSYSYTTNLPSAFNSDILILNGKPKKCHLFPFTLILRISVSTFRLHPARIEAQSPWLPCKVMVPKFCCVLPSSTTSPEPGLISASGSPLIGSSPEPMVRSPWV